MPRVLLVPDCYGWCWWHQATAIQRYAPEGYEVDVKLPSDLTADTTADYDGMLFFSWPECPTAYVHCRLVTVLAHHGIEHDPWQSVTDGRKRDARGEHWPAVAATNIRNRREALRVLPEVDGVICVNKRLHKVAEQYNPASVFLPAGVDCDFWRVEPVREHTPMRIGWCGQHGGQPNTKGYEWILSPLMRTLRDVEWVINTRSSAEALSPEDMRRWYESIDLFLCTSISEGTPAPVLEAAACGRPVVSTNVGDVQAVASALAGCYRDKKSAAVVVKQLANIIETFRGRCGECGTFARERVVAHRSWESLAPRWLEYVAGG